MVYNTSNLSRNKWLLVQGNYVSQEPIQSHNFRNSHHGSLIVPVPSSAKTRNPLILLANLRNSIPVSPPETPLHNIDITNFSNGLGKRAAGVNVIRADFHGTPSRSLQLSKNRNLSSSFVRNLHLVPLGDTDPRCAMSTQSETPTTRWR